MIGQPPFFIGWGHSICETALENKAGKEGAPYSHRPMLGQQAEGTQEEHPPGIDIVILRPKAILCGGKQEAPALRPAVARIRFQLDENYRTLMPGLRFCRCRQNFFPHRFRLGCDHGFAGDGRGYRCR
jgi:hypothetical protein